MLLNRRWPRTLLVRIVLRLQLVRVGFHRPAERGEIVSDGVALGPARLIVGEQFRHRRAGPHFPRRIQPALSNPARMGAPAPIFERSGPCRHFSPLATWSLSSAWWQRLQLASSNRKRPCSTSASAASAGGSWPGRWPRRLNGSGSWRKPGPCHSSSTRATPLGTLSNSATRSDAARLRAAPPPSFKFRLILCRLNLQYLFAGDGQSKLAAQPDSETVAAAVADDEVALPDNGHHLRRQPWMRCLAGFEREGDRRLQLRDFDSLAASDALEHRDKAAANVFRLRSFASALPGGQCDEQPRNDSPVTERRSRPAVSAISSPDDCVVPRRRTCRDNYEGYAERGATAGRSLLIFSGRVDMGAFARSNGPSFGWRASASEDRTAGRPTRPHRASDFFPSQ